MAVVVTPFEIARHPQAPIFSEESNPALVLRQLVEEVSSGGRMSTTESVRQLLRQAGLVNLWFFLKFIAGYSGPYNLLNEGLHLEVCNFRQKVATKEGARTGIYLPRGAYKSTICTHGAAQWRLIRNPNLRIGIASEINDRSESFVKVANSTFRDNEFFRWLYPEHQKANRDDTSLVLTSRTRKMVDPNLQAITTGGSTQGIHLDDVTFDDPVGDDMLNSDRSPTADMYRVTNWIYDNMNTLLVSVTKSNVELVGTRYCVDDPYEPTMVHAKAHYGDWDGLEESEYPIDPSGPWEVYYRPVICRGQNIIPDVISTAELEKMRETNPWLYWTQYMNRARMIKEGELGGFKVGIVDVEWNQTLEGYELVFEDSGERRQLAGACVVGGADPAASEKRVGTGTSRSSAGVIARFSDDVVVILEAKAGFVSPTTFFDWIFEHAQKYGVMMGTTFVEAQAGFKAFIPLLRKEIARRGSKVGVVGVPALGEKQTTIKNILWPFLERGKLYVRREVANVVLEELRIFPSKRMDVLDMVKIAVFKSWRPAGGSDGGVDSDDDEENDTTSRRRQYVSKVSGY